LRDVPFFVWSESLSQTTSPYSSEDTVASSNLIPLLSPLIEKSNPEVVVLFYESQLQTYEVSSFNSPSSVFAMIQQNIKKNKNSVVIPYVHHDSIFPSLLGRALHGSTLNYHTGPKSTSFSFIKSTESLESLKNHEIFSNGKSDLLIIELNHNGDSLQDKFETSGKVMKEVEQILKEVKHISIYTGTPQQINELDSVFLKRSVHEEVEAFNVTPIEPISTIQAISPFNYWFPGWFWELSTVVILVFGISSFGIYQLFSIPVTLRLAQPKKIKNL
jgi:hypothetical protein